MYIITNGFSTKYRKKAYYFIFKQNSAAFSWGSIDRKVKNSRPLVLPQRDVPDFDSPEEALPSWRSGLGSGGGSEGKWDWHVK